MKITRKKMLLGAGAALLGTAIVFNGVASGDKDKAEEAGWSDFVQKAEDGHFSSAEVSPGRVIGVHVDDAGVKTKETAKTGELSVDYVTEELTSRDVKVSQKEAPGSSLTDTLLGFVPMALIIFAIYYFVVRPVRRGPAAADKPSMAPAFPKDNHTRFADVAGLDEAKAEVMEVVDFLRHPEKFQRLGAKVPKGVLLVGPPGTGKTMLARAVAGEAGVPFFQTSGSAFVEMFVGLGARRVREIFEQAKACGTAIIFIDEIDALGKKRGGGYSGNTSEHEQTLNQLLVEMDGFSQREGCNVIVLAATNQPDVLDEALKRPGRFDRQVAIDLPDVTGREDVLKIHTKGKPLDADVDLREIARGTPGFSPAELANVVNEAAILAARRNANGLGQADFNQAVDKVVLGLAGKVVADPEVKALTAYHEAGHTLALLHEKDAPPLHKVTIVPRGGSGGHTAWLPKEEGLQGTRGQLEARLRMAVGGRVAERLIFGDNNVTGGASSDIAAATGIARRMIIELGMSEALGMVDYSPLPGGIPGGDPATAQKINDCVKAEIDAAEAFVTKVLTENLEQLHVLAQELMEKETLSAEQVRALVTGICKVEDPLLAAPGFNPGVGVKPRSPAPA